MDVVVVLAYRPTILPYIALISSPKNNQGLFIPHLSLVRLFVQHLFAFLVCQDGFI